MNISRKILKVAVIAMVAVACKDSKNTEINTVKTKDLEGNYIGSIKVVPYNSFTNTPVSTSESSVQDTVAMVLDKALPDQRLRCFSKKLGTFYVDINRENSDQNGGYVFAPIQAYTGPGADKFTQTSTLNTQTDAYYDRHFSAFTSMLLYHRYSNSKVVATYEYRYLTRIR